MLLTATFVLGYFNLKAQRNNEQVSYYYYGDERIPIEIKPDVYLINTIDPEQLPQQLASLNMNEFKIENVGREKNLSSQLVTIESPRNLKEVQQIMSELPDKFSSITYVSAAYQTFARIRNYVTPIEPVYVQFKENVSFSQINTLAALAGLQYAGLDPDDLDGDVYEFTAVNPSVNLISAANQIFESGNAIFAEANTIEYGKIKSNEFEPLQWGINNTGQTICDGTTGTPGDDAKVDEAWIITKGAGTRIAILDDGMDLTHPDLSIAAHKDFVGSGSGEHIHDLDGHGTLCAGIAAAKDNSIGVVGVAPEAQLLAGRIITSVSGGGGIALIKVSDVKKAIKWAWKDHNADVISGSWFKSSKSFRIRLAIKKAKNKGRNGKGTVVLFAAGNAGTNQIDWPAELDHVIAVGASDLSDQRAFFSNTGSEIDVVAPGVAMYTTDRQGGFGENRGAGLDLIPSDDANTDYFECFNGTSAATPFAAGVCALIIARNNSLTADQVQDILEETADDIGTAGFDNETGHGRVNAFKAVEQYCLASGNEVGSYHRASKNYQVHKFVAGEVFLVAGKALIKASNVGGTGQNMFALQQSGSNISSIPGYSYWKGTQVFSSKISDVDYIAGYTVVSLTDGRIVKINGTGGTGQNMFAISEHPNGFTGVPGYSYYVGSHRFNSGIIDVTHISGKTIISFENKKILKVNNAGGSGFNLFAISESSSAFTGLAGYSYYVGTQKFGAKISHVENIGSITFFCFTDGRIMKISGSGGSGARMFNVEQTSYGFQTYNAAYTAYLIGSQKFSTAVSDMEYINSKTLIGFNDGKMMKVNGTGGSGQRIFNVTESASGFSTYDYAYSVYLSGHQKFDSRVTDIDYTGSRTIISFYNGKMLKVSGNGGTGAKMFNVAENSLGFQLHSGAYTNYLVGSTNFNSSVVSLNYIDGVSFVALSNGKWIKVSGYGGGGYNMFALVENGSHFVSVCGYDYLKGNQNFSNSLFSREISDEEEENAPLSAEDDLMIYPNPTEDHTIVYIKTLQQNNKISVMDVKGVLIETQHAEEKNTRIDMSTYAKGLYLIRIENGSESMTRKIIKN